MVTPKHIIVRSGSQYKWFKTLQDRKFGSN